MKRLPRDQQKKLADDAQLMRAWKNGTGSNSTEALAGAHGAIVAELMTLLDQLELSSAAALLDLRSSARIGPPSATTSV